MKFAQWILALAAVFALGATQAQTEPREDKRPKKAAKKNSGKAHKHKAGEKHHDDEDHRKPKAKATP